MASTFTTRDLVNSDAILDATMQVKGLIEWFKTNPTIEYATVFHQDRICGLVSRESLNARIAGNKFGYSVMAEQPITKVMINDPMIVEADMPMEELVRQIVHGRADSPRFYEDIIVHDKGSFLGLASVKRLIVRQMEYIQEQMRAMEKHHQVLAKKNKELFEATLRVETDQAQYQGFFEKCSIPMIVFEKGGQPVRANTRFHRLTGYTTENLLVECHATRLIANNGFQMMLARHANSRSEFGAYKPTYTLSLLKTSGEKQGVEVSFNLDENTGHIIVSILRVISDQELAIDELVQRRVATETSGLARSVAENLIDKELNLDAARQKIDAVISLADKIEKKPGRAEVNGESGRHSSQNLRGDLGQFSMVDLAQVLVQGRKTGELTVTQESGVTGVVYFEQGFITHALYQNQRGRRALMGVVGIERGSFLFTYDTPAPEHTIVGDDPMGVLLKVFTEMDEEEGFADSHLASLD